MQDTREIHMPCAIPSRPSGVCNTDTLYPSRSLCTAVRPTSIHLHYAGRGSEIAIRCQTGYKKEVERAAAEKALRMTSGRNYRLQWHA